MKSLMKEKRWCVWAFLKRDGANKPTKVPFVGKGRKGQSDHPENWQTYDEMAALLADSPKLGGLGFFLSERESDDDLVLGAIDIDAHHMENGEENPLSKEIIEMFKGTYIEYSPSGNGYHILFNMDRNRIPRDDNGELAYKQKDDKTDLEIYIGTATKRYMTYTGKRVSETDEITDQTEAVLEFIDKFMNKPLKVKVIAKSRERLPVIHYQEPLQNEEIKKRLKDAQKGEQGKLFKALYETGKLPEGMGHKKEGGNGKDTSDSVAEWMLLKALIYWLGPDPVAIDQAFRSSALMRTKWDTKRRNETYGQYRIRTALEAFHVYCPYPGKYGDGVCRAISDKPNMPIKDLINLVVKDDEHKNEVSVLPLLCGMGKSQAISQIIRQTLETEHVTGNGLLVITDRTYRLHDYMEPYDPELRQFLKENESRITILDSESIEAGALREQEFKPVLMMTTQRFFSLSREEVLKFLNWSFGTRPLVLIDERPNIRSNVGIDAEAIGLIKAALNNVFQGRKGGIPYALGLLLRDCEFMIETMQDTFTDQERYGFFWKPDFDSYHQQTEDSEIDVLSEIGRNRMDLQEGINARQASNVFQSIHAILDMEKEAGLVQSRRIWQEGSTKRYQTIIGTMTDNRHCIHDIPAKVIIMDGTAEISPEYLLDNYDFRWDCETKRPLTHLKVKIIKLNTTKRSIDGARNRKYAAMVSKAVKQYVDMSGIREDPNWVLFTYKDHQDTMNRTVNAPNTDYFGNIIGRNIYNNAKNIVQVGLNRLPGWVYFRIMLDYYPEIKNKLVDVNKEWKPYSSLVSFSADTPIELIESQDAILKEFTKAHRDDLQEIMCRSLFAECEQMIFRGIIRNADCNEDYTYHMFIDADAYPELVSQMMDRYIPLGAQIEIIETPVIAVLFGLMERSGLQGKPTQLQKLVTWHDELEDDEIYGKSDMMTAAGCKNDASWRKFKSVHKEVLEPLLETERMPDGDKYSKKANWYFP